MIGAAVAHRALWMATFGHLWQVGLVIALLWALERRLLRRAPARYQSALWWLALLHLALPAPLLARGLGAAWPTWGGAEPGSAGVTVITTLRAVLRPEALGAGAEVTAGASPLWPALSLLWLLGALLMAWALWRHGSREAAAAATVTEPVGGKRLAAAARLAGVAPDRVRLVDADCLPRAAGLLRPRILLSPRLTVALSTRELAAILAHEEAHCRRRDGVARLLCVPVLLLFWFFPPTWLVLRRLRRAAELACDEAVLRAGFRPELYARALARTVRLGLALPVATPALAGSGADIRLRLERLRRVAGESTSMKRHMTVLAMAVALVGLSVATAAPGATHGLQRVQGGESAGSAVERTLLETLPGADRQVTLEAREQPLTWILRRLATTGGFELDVAGIDDLTVSLEARGTVAAALAVLASANELLLEVQPPNTLVVRPVRRIGGEIQAPERVRYVPPAYPPDAREAGVQGVVILEAQVLADGTIDTVEVLRGLHPSLDEAAREAVRQWRYTPTLYDGGPVPILLTVTVQFELQEEGR